MSQQQLIDHFNDRLRREYQNREPALVLRDGRVYGQFGGTTLSTRLIPVRETQQTHKFLGYKASLEIGVNTAAPEQFAEDSVIGFDRLSRIVHVLNYLPQAHVSQLLFLDVDPRHILAVKSDHGAYFEEILNQCGLNTGNVVISLSIDNEYSRLYNLFWYFSLLVKGLENYQRRGYRLLLTFPADNLDQSSLELIRRLSPDFAGLSLQHVASSLSLSASAARLADLSKHSILLGIDDPQGLSLARQMGFQYVQGDYLEQAGFVPPAQSQARSVSP